ncbi:hypothetical protein AB2_07 [Acinetobacter phage vB_AbaM-IME-AB2]|uniref:Uncharacterized protein n=1 Tax=Acinetobacter phage vB_AbaM-IME-AB2 TaxID=1243183 RepID=K4NXS0_9CAUD|nr:hypothetical protein FDG67_gp07 [Acinetobacter phage vB_AbaM-IME-AB2]AFV51491.1 hypothetical protein AB2_07 [Acinetobacter phage vB_AbaM-IME-AB2]
MAIYLNIEIDKEKLTKLCEIAIENFKKYEQNQLNDVDIDKCVDDYISAVLIYNTRLTKLIWR